MRAPERRGRHGQGVTEYVIIVAMIAIAAIGAIATFGDDLRILFGGMTASLSGDTNVTVNVGSYVGIKDTDTLQTFGNNPAAALK